MRNTILRATSADEALDEAFDGPFVVPLAHVLQVADPRHGDPWGSGVISESDVRQHVAARTECEREHPFDEERAACRTCNLTRVAHFVAQGLDPHDPHPIVVDVGIGQYVPVWPIEDGNHRLLAASVRGDELVVVEPFGDWSRAVAVLIEGRDLDVVMDENELVI